MLPFLFCLFESNQVKLEGKMDSDISHYTSLELISHSRHLSKQKIWYTSYTGLNNATLVESGRTG